MSAIEARLAALPEKARRAAAAAVAAEAAALAGDALRVEPGATPFEKRLVATRPAQRFLLRALLLGAQDFSRRLAAALTGALR